ncbi:EscU/YscU/HrcU family type III secretion system export apparatus switch protein [Congregibacter litoralis]|uniref:Flagellar biosynthetic protein FlhB n=1 Tax=Congregibacter litoralis KT71 TaxID=314285 RepID=A4A5X2_9GAMM|nr:EscU/YscU/HrcU family type III secretion system export apparatus switch protein [Congregibacter litoralis]EAQ98419.1 cytoplasmic domain of flagellar protein FhlB-like protein [Congregibacter litoralis KT71]
MSDNDKRSQSSAKGPATQSAALSYSGEGAPLLVAKGENAIADRIVELASQNDVPIVQDGQLTELLCQIPLGEEVPPELYLAVAEVLAYVYRLNEQLDRHV